MERFKQIRDMQELVHAHARYRCGLCGYRLTRRALGGFWRKKLPLGYVEYLPICNYCIRYLNNDEKV